MRITVGDKILIVFLFIFNGWLFINFGIGFSEGDWVVVEVNQNEVARLALATDQTAQVKGPLGVT